MFETLLEKVLSKFLGDFIEGFDASNLHVGIWSGEVTICNVSLKADILKMLELPLGIRFSHIGKLKLNVPWKSLTSAPVEVYLEDLFIIISAQHPDEWVFQDYSGFKKKFEMLEKFKEQIIQKIMEKDKKNDKDDKEAGYIQKLTLKIIDNIQLSINNIHIRFEDTLRTEFSWGIALQSLEVFTTDSQWNKKYFDRTKEENKKVPLQKLVTLKNVGAYWNQAELDFYFKLSKEETLVKMKEIIINTQDPKQHKMYAQYILLINAQAKLIQNTSGSFDSPEFDFNVGLQTIDLALENLQLQQVIRMAEMFSLFQNRLNKQKKQTLKLSNQQIEEQKLLFCVNYDKIIRSKDQSLKALSKDEAAIFEQAVSNLDIDTLFAEAKIIIKRFQKEEAIKQAEDAKKKSWFGGGSWFGGKKKDDDLIDEAEKEKLAQFIDELAEGTDIKQIKRPADYVWLSAFVSLENGSVHIMKQFDIKREGIQLSYNQFTAVVKVTDGSQFIQLGLQRIAIDLVTEPVIEGKISMKDQKRVSVMEPVTQQKFLDFVFETNPTHHPGVDKYIKLTTQSLKFVFNPLLLVRVNQFIDFQVKDDTLKNAAWDSVEAAQDLAANQVQQSQLSPSILFLDITIAAPYVLVPFLSSQEVWFLNLGQLKVITPKIDDVYYDHFEVSLSDLTFKYFENINECNQSIAGQQIGKQYAVIQKFEITINASVLRGSAKAPDQYPQVKVSGILPDLELFISPAIYERVLKIGDCFAEPVQDPEEIQKKLNRLSIEQAQTDRTELMNNASFVKKIWKRQGAPLYTWESYTGVLSGGYIYLFATAKDKQPNLSIWIRNSDFIDVPQAECGMENAFIIKNKYTDIMVAGDKANFTKQWKEKIEEQRTIPRGEQKKDKVVKQDEKQKVPRPMIFGFQVSGFGLHIQDEQNIDWLNVNISGLGASAEMLNGSIELILKLNDLSVTDAVQEYLDPNMKYIVRSEQDPESNELITIKILQLNDKDPRYKKINLNVDVTFGTLQAILKPLAVAKLLLFVTPKKPSEDIAHELLPDDKKQREEAKKALEQQATQQQTKLDTMQDIILMSVAVRITSVKATLVHRFTKLPLAEMNIQNTHIELIKYVDELQLKGSLGNLQLIDLTNYPNTLSEEKDYPLIKPKEMIGVKSQQESLLKINLRILSEGSPKIQNNILILIQVEMSELIINFMMQPVMRLLDFTLQQLLFALSNPQKTVDPTFEQQLKIEQQEEFKGRQETKQQSIVLSKDENDFLTRQLENPPGLSIDVQIKHPQVILKPNQEYKSALVIDLGNIHVTNQRNKVHDRSNDREVLNDVWVDLFILNMTDIKMYQIKNDNTTQEFSLPFDLNVKIELFPMAQQYQIKYPQLAFDQQIKIYTYLAPMIIQLTHRDYMYIMKCLFHNIAYDDGFDNMIRLNNPNYFKAFFEEQEAQARKQKELLEKGDENPGLSFQLDLENMTLFLQNQVEPKPTPFLRMMLVMMRVSFVKQNNGTAKVGLLIRDMEGSVFNELLEQEFQELPFIGPMNVNQNYSYQQVINLNGLVNGRQAAYSKIESSLALASRGQLTSDGKRSKVFRFEDTEQHSDVHPSYKLNLSLIMRLNGDKVIDLDLADFKLMAHAGSLFKALGLIAMDDPELTPPPGKYQVKQEVQQQQAGGQLAIRVGLNNVITCVPTNVDNSVLAIRGVIDIELIMRPQLTLEQFRQEVDRLGLQEKDFINVNKNMEFRAKLEKLEICICRAYDLAKREDFQTVKRRQILAPISIKAEIIKAMVAQRDFRSFRDVTHISANVSQTNLKISFKDISLLQSGLQYQLSQLPQQPQQPEIKKDEEQKKQEQQELQKIVNQQVTEIKIGFESERLQIIILNDIGNTFTPLLDFEVDATKLILVKNNVFLSITTNVIYKLNYYNPRASKWEPVIETVGFQIELYQSMIPGISDGTVITIEQTEQFEDFNVTVSTTFIQIIFRAMILMKKMFQPQKEQTKSIVSERSSSEDTMSSVSPYVVRNLTGHPIIVSPKQENLKPLQLGTGQQQNIQLSEQEELSNQQVKKVKIVIKTPRQEVVLKDQIDMDKIRSKIHKGDYVDVYCNLKLDPITNSKVLIVSSPIVFVNQTNQNIIIQIQDKNNESIQKMVKLTSDRDLDHISPLPLGFINAKFALRFESCPNYSEPQLIEKILTQEQKVIEIQTSDKLFIVLNIQKDKDGRVRILLEPPFKITNSLPKDIFIQILNDMQETTLTRKLAVSESIEDYKNSQNKRAFLRVLLQGFYWSEEYKLYSREEGQQHKDDCYSQLKLIDSQERPLSLLVFEPWKLETKSKATREFVIHCSGYILNQTGYNVLFLTSKDRKDKQSQAVPGQEPINHKDPFDQELIILGPECGSFLELSEKSAKEMKSQNSAPIGTIGEPVFDMIIKDDDNKPQQVFMGCNIKLKMCNSKYTLFNKIVSVEPRFILINQTKRALILRASSTHGDQMISEPNSRVPYQRPYDENNKNHDIIKVNIKVSQEDYQWSGDVEISSIGIVYFQVRNQNDQSRLYFSCDTRAEDCNIFVIINEIPKEQAPYKFVNNCPNIEIKIPDIPAIINSDQKEAFYAWDDPCQADKNLGVELHVTDQPEKYKKLVYKLQPDHIGLQRIYTFYPLKGSGGKPVTIQLRILPNGFQKQIIVDIPTPEEIKLAKEKPKQDFLKQAKQDKFIQNEDEDLDDRSLSLSRQSTVQNNDDKIKSKLVMNLKKFTLSLVHNSDSKKRPAEYMLITVQNLEFAYISNYISNVIQLRIQYVNIDHNSQFFVNFPVIFTPLKYGPYQKGAKQEKYFLNILIMKDPIAADINLFQTIVIDIDPFAVKVEDMFINAMLEYVSAILNFKTKVEEYEKVQIYDKQDDQKEVVIKRDLLWKIQELPAPSLPTYINQLALSPIEIQLTFMLKTKSNDLGSDDMALFKSIAQALGVVLANIDEAPIRFTGLELINCFDTVSGLTSKMIKQYKTEAIKQVLMIVGSLSVIGNPVGLFNNVSTGMKDLIQKPAQGLAQGPLEGGLGLVQGAGSLVSHTIAGAFNSVNKITGTLGGGLATLTMDEDYIKEREKMRLQKPKHLGDGVGQGAKAVFQGVTSGIAGLFLKPFQGAKQGGAKGALKGVFMGITGLVTKPIEGVLTAAAKLAEGAKNTVEYFDDKPNQVRARSIRSVYGAEGYIAEYNILDAESFSAVCLLKKGELINDRFVESILLVPDQKEPENKYWLILTLENIILLSFKTKKKEWIISLNDYAHIEQIPQGIKIFVKKPLKSLKNKKEVLLVLDLEMKNTVYKSINALIDLSQA